MVPDRALSLSDGAIAAWGRAEGAFLSARARDAWRSRSRSTWTSPGRSCSKANREARAARRRWRQAESPGAATRECIPGLEATQPAVRAAQAGARPTRSADALAYLEDELQRFAREATCPDCEGTRLSPLARHVTRARRDPAGAVRAGLWPSCASIFPSSLEAAARASIVTERLLRDIRSRVGALLDLGLDYLSLDRSAATLSGGEIERIRLATQIGSGLVGVLYVLDEPSAGLHARDNERLIASLHRLRDQGNSVLVVEHDEATIRAADHVIDLGPGAGARRAADGAGHACRARRACPTRPREPT